MLEAWEKYIPPLLPHPSRSGYCISTASASKAGPLSVAVARWGWWGRCWHAIPNCSRLNVVTAGVSWLLRSVDLLIKNNELKQMHQFSVCLCREIILPSRVL